MSEASAERTSQGFHVDSSWLAVLTLTYPCPQSSLRHNNFPIYTRETEDQKACWLPRASCGHNNGYKLANLKPRKFILPKFEVPSLKSRCPSQACAPLQSPWGHPRLAFAGDSRHSLACGSITPVCLCFTSPSPLCLPLPRHIRILVIGFRAHPGNPQ